MAEAAAGDRAGPPRLATNARNASLRQNVCPVAQQARALLPCCGLRVWRPAWARARARGKKIHNPSAMSLSAQLALLGLALGAQAASQPNIVYALVDDLGYANVGFHGEEPLTPNIDSLVKDGVELMRFYTYRFCSPTRSSFMSGRLPIHVNQINRPPNVGGGGVPLGMTTLAERLASTGYRTHQIGKWHCGMSVTAKLPVNRGFNSSFGYLSGAEDHFAQTRDGQVDFWRDRQPAHGENGTYGTFQYAAEAEKIVKNHPSDAPIFIYLAFQNMHGPDQAPDKYINMFPNVSYKPRRMADAMMAVVDEAIGQVVDALKAQGMWENTLFIFSSDNGGPVDHANNYPLRGSKGNDFEGGVRVPAFISGGFVPSEHRGKSVDGLMHICDWLATFSTLAGYSVPDERAKAAGLPPVDSLDMWSMLSFANATSPRTELMLRGGNSTSIPGSGLIATVDGIRYKLIRGEQGNGAFPGKLMPNATSGGKGISIDCGAGCLFDLDSDPTEHVDLANDKPELLKRLQDLAASYDATYFQEPGEANADPEAKKAAENKYGGFWGPWQDNE